MVSGDKFKNAQNDDEKRAIKVLFDELQNYDDATQNLRDKWKECWNLYINKLEKSDYPWLSQKFIPKVHRAVNLLTAFMAGGNPTLNVYPEGEEDEVKAEFMRELLQFQWAKTLMMRQKLLTTVKSSILFGTGIVKVGWMTRMTEFTEVQKRGKKKKKVTKKYLEYDDPVVDPINMFDYYQDPYAPTPEDSYSNIERRVMTVQEVKTNPSYKNRDKVLPMGRARAQSIRRDSSILDDTDLTESSDPIDRVEILEREGLFKINGKMTESIITIANGKSPVVLRIVPNPDGFRHFVDLKFTQQPLPNRFYGIGAIEPNINTQRGINSLSNQIIDNISATINAMFLRRRGANVDAKQLVWRPSGFIDVDDVDQDIKQLQVTDKTNAGFQLLQYFNAEFEEGTAATSQRKGGGDAGTATEAQIQDRNINLQTSLFKESIEDFISKIGTRLVDLNVRNITGAKSMRVFDIDTAKRVREITNEALQGTTLPFIDEEKLRRYGLIIKMASGKTLSGKYDVKVTADSTILYDHNIIRKQLLDWLLTMGKLGLTERVDIERVTEDLGRLSGLPNSDKYIKREVPRPPVPGGNPATPLGVQGGAPTPQARNRKNEAGVPSPLVGEQMTQRAIQSSVQKRASAI